MRFIIVDNRQFLPRDGRLNTVIGVISDFTRREIIQDQLPLYFPLLICRSLRKLLFWAVQLHGLILA
jgi:hypothetical protein